MENWEEWLDVQVKAIQELESKSKPKPNQSNPEVNE